MSSLSVFDIIAMLMRTGMHLSGVFPALRHLRICSAPALTEVQFLGIESTTLNPTADCPCKRERSSRLNGHCLRLSKMRLTTMEVGSLVHVHVFGAKMASRIAANQSSAFMPKAPMPQSTLGAGLGFSEALLRLTPGRDEGYTSIERPVSSRLVCNGDE